ncbi:hypothetical protein LJC27_06685 [Christensenellaceae bacterium OttesenSCG-928-M15]|nr:hypothetical protein [Christensenellaceae bacterium OttesenSCG-928-M15]
MKNKRIIAIIIAVAILAMSAAPGFAASKESLDKEVRTIQLKGFSYSMDGRQIDQTNDLTLNVSYKLGDNPWLSIDGLNKLDILRKGNAMERILLSEIGGNNYYGDIKLKDSVVGSVYLEMVNGDPIIDVLINDRNYAFGGNRRTLVEKEMQKVAAVNKEPSISEITPKAAAGIIFTKSNSKIYCQAAFNPSKSNRVDIRVHTKSNQVTTWVNRCVISGNVPPAYVIMSCNPAGLPAGSSVDWGYVINLILGNQALALALPGQSARTLSTWANNRFTFDLNGNGVAWNDMHDSSGSKRKGFAGYIFLDHNGGTPNISGSVKITYRVSLVGAFTETLDLPIIL